MAKKKNKTKILVIILILLIIIAAGLLYFKITKNEESNITNNPLVALLEEKPEEIEIYKGTDRPIAIMIDNVRKCKTTGRSK